MVFLVCNKTPLLVDSTMALQMRWPADSTSIHLKPSRGVCVDQELGCDAINLCPNKPSRWLPTTQKLAHHFSRLNSYLLQSRKMIKFMFTVEIVHITRLIKTNSITQKKRESRTNNTHVKDRPSTGNCSKLPRNHNRKKGLRWQRKVKITGKRKCYGWGRQTK